MSRLTEANYQSRRIKLVQHIKAAEDAHAEAAFRAEISEATDADVKVARGNVDELKDRLTGLDLAWKRTLETVAAEAKAARSASRAEAHKAATSALAARAKAAKKMSDAAIALATGYKNYTDAGEQVLSIALAHRSAFGTDELISFRENLSGSFADIRPAIMGEVRAHGLSLNGFGASGLTSTGTNRDSNAVEAAAFSNDRLEATISRLLDAEQA